jgi:dTDP-4-dehydrorhamnose 3,5-epimerase
MKFTRSNIKDIIICEPDIHGDNRGYFIETFRTDKLEEFLGFKVDFCQDNESKSSLGVLRGLHYQMPPYAQSKLIRVIQGKILDIAVDIRRKSPTFGKYVSIELSGKNKKQIFIPRGFAHGFVAIEDNTILAYKVDNYFNANSDRGIYFNDKDINIDWILDEKHIVLSAKDEKQKLLKDTKDIFEYGVNYYE